MANLVQMQFVRDVVVEEYEAKAYGLDAGPAKVSDYWVETVLSDPQWVLAARIVPDRIGNVAIGEIRIFPNEKYRPEQYSGTGMWGGEVRGINVQNIPRGGLPSTLLRRGVRLGEIERNARMTVSITLPLKGLPTDHPVGIQAKRLEGAGFRYHPIFPKKSQRGGLGRPRLDDLVYAKLAKAYVDAFNRTGRPVPELAKVTGEKPAAIRSRIARARAEGFLSPAVKHGTGGGSLTEKTRKIIEASSQRIATGSVTARSKAPQRPVGKRKKARQSSRGKKRA